MILLDGVGPKYGQITRALCASIQSGAAAPGSRLPSTRYLARELGVSRNIVLLAYEQLMLEGYVVSRRGGGTYVSPGLHRPAASPPRVRTERSGPARLSSSGVRLVQIASRARRTIRRARDVAVDFMYGLCEPDARVAARLGAAFTSALKERRFAYGAVPGDEELRRQVADRLVGIRGIWRSPDEILITSGAQQAMD